MIFQSSKKHLKNFIDSAIDTHLKLPSNGHNITVIAMDFVPIIPSFIEVLDITMEQMATMWSLKLIRQLLIVGFV